MPGLCVRSHYSNDNSQIERQHRAATVVLSGAAKTNGKVAVKGDITSKCRGSAGKRKEDSVSSKYVRDSTRYVNVKSAVDFSEESKAYTSQQAYIGCDFFSDLKYFHS